MNVRVKKKSNKGLLKPFRDRHDKSGRDSNWGPNISPKPYHVF